MARFLVKASEFKNVCKAVNDRKLAELKKEIIEILKKQDENEVKKAVDYFNSQELHYTHLEKSLNGKWIEKAGYGVGTVRIWKGKKYKKIAPGKWARVFDKEGRGTNIAIGKLIARVNKIDNAEDLLQFVMENKQRFIDEEGKELSIINKVRAAVDARNEKLSGESTPYVYGVGEEVSAAKNEMFSKKDKITKEEADLHKISRKYSQIPTSELKQRKAKLDRWIDNKTRNKRDRLNNAIFRDSYKNEVEAINKELEKRSKGTVDNKVLDKYKTDAKNMTTEQLEYYVEDLKNGTGNIGKENLEERIKIYGDELNKRKGAAEKKDSRTSEKKSPEKLLKEMGFETMEKVSFNGDKWEVAGVNLDYNGNANGISLTPDRQAGNLHSSNVTVFDIDKIQKNKPAEKKEDVDYSKMSEDELNELNKKLRQTIKEKDYGEADEEMEQINKISKQKIINSYKTKERHTLQHVEDVEQKKKMIADSKAIVEKDLARKEKQRIKESSIAKKNQLADEIDELKYKKAAFEQLEKEFEKEPDNENKTYWIQDNRGNRLTNEDAKKKIIGQMEYLAELEDMAGKKLNNRTANDIRYYIDYLKDRLNPEDRKEIESEAEKHQNRSDAMKGNQNAKKYGLTEEQIERYDIQEVVEDVNGYGIVKNSEGKYSYIDDGRVKDRPDDFETSIEKVKERINDTYETKKNIQAAKDYDFKNAKLGSDIEYTKRSDGKHLYFKKSPDGSKAISVTVEVSDMREPLNMTYEVSDTKSGESWQYETAYGNKEGLEWAVERPEQMEKELKKFFKRDPEKEWNKQNTTDSITNFESEGKVVSYDELKPIATNKSVGENEVQMPYSKDIAAEIEALKKCVYELPDRSREFMRHVYYVDGNLVATDGRRMKVVKVGELDGISDGSYVDITTNKSGINIKKKEVEGNFPNYKKVIPDNLNQTATLDTKLVKEKIKEMRKDGAIDKKGVNLVQLEFRDGKVFIDDTPVGNAKDIALKFSKNWGETTDDTNFVDFNADYLENALTGKTAVLQMGDRADKAMAINTGSTSNIVMPMSGNGEKRDYSGNRMARDAENEAKDKKKADNRRYNESKIKEYTPKNVNINIDDMKNRMKEMSDEELKRNYDMLTFNLDKVMDKKMFTTGSAKVDSKLGLDLAHAVAYKAIVEKYPEVKDIVSSELESRGISVKKSLFDDFIVDVFAADNEDEIEDELYEGETEYNDYSAEQPELFNSTSMKVREALDRIRNQVL